MTKRLSPQQLARLDQIHQTHVAQFESMIANPGLLDALNGQGEAVFCADVTNTITSAVEAGGVDVDDLAAYLAIAFAKVLRLRDDLARAQGAA